MSFSPARPIRVVVSPSISSNKLRLQCNPCLRSRKGSSPGRSEHWIDGARRPAWILPQSRPSHPPPSQPGGWLRVPRWVEATVCQSRRVDATPVAMRSSMSTMSTRSDQRGGRGISPGAALSPNVKSQSTRVETGNRSQTDNRGRAIWSVLWNTTHVAGDQVASSVAETK
jgi:hypothetical protein